LFEDGHDLAIGEAGGFHRISFKSNNLEIQLLSQVKGWGYYPSTDDAALFSLL
jgi:hypothetical protein